MIPATYPSILDSSNRTKMLVYQVPSITGLTRWIDYIPVKSPTSESDLTLANTFANEGFILTSKVNDITGLVPFKDYIPIYLDSTATKAWSADNDGYIPMAELAGLLLDFTTGSLDSRINFTRTTNATVTNSAGQITYAPHNLLTYSEQFDNAAWTKTTTTVTANAIASPTSTTTGDTLTAGGANSTTLHSYTAIAQPYTFSIYIRRRTGTGVIEITADGSTYVAKTITSAWTRFDTTITPTAGTRTPGVRIVTSGDAIDVWGAQLEIGSTATTYNSTTVKNLLGYSELFDNAAWTKSNSFVQTNLLTYSEAFDNAAWAKTTITATANSIAAPNGYQTADTLLASGANSTALQTFTASAVPYTFSVYLYRKTGTGNIDITVDGTTWVTKTITAGWTRVDTTLTPAAGSKTAGIRIVTSGNEVYAWGAQLVQGSVAGDYRRTDSTSLPVYYPNHNGVVCAEQLHGTAANGTILESYTATGGSMTFSLWMRRITGAGNVDITMDTGVTWTTQAITTSWARYSVTSTPTAGARTAGIRLVTSGDVIQVFGGMVSDSASLDPYVLNAAAAPTAAAYYGARFDYGPVTLAPKGLLIEEQRANLLTYSEAFDNAIWGKLEASVTANTILAPNGYQTADKLIESTAATQHGIQVISYVSGVTQTISIYAKSAGESRYLQISGGGIGGISECPVFNLDTGTVDVAATTSIVKSATISSVGNGWYRCSAVVVPINTTLQILVSSNSTSNTPDAYTGDGTSGLYLWGAQLEAGAFATSYIPTAASQVTRAVDVATIQGSNFYSWINQNEGSILASGVTNNTNTSTLPTYLSLSQSTTAQYNIALLNASNVNPIIYLQVDAGTNQAGVTGIGNARGSFNKVGGAYKINDFQFSVNNTLGAGDTSGNIPLVEELKIGRLYTGGQPINGTIKSISYYPQRLSDSVLKGLTA